MGFPRLSETFIASEIHRVEHAGVPVRLFVIKPVEEREQRLRHPVADAIRAQPQYLPDASSLTAPLHRWRARHLRPFLPALRRVARRRPLGLARTPRTAFGPGARDRRTPLSRPAEDLHQGAAAGRRARRPAPRRAGRAPPARPLRPRHDDDHLARRADRRPAVLFTGHARDIYAPRPEPAGLAAAQAARRPLRGHVHGGQPPPSAARSPPRQRSTSSITASTPTSRGCSRPRRPPARNGDLRVLGVGRLVAKKGFDVLVEACDILRGRDVPFEARSSARTTSTATP